jgi:peptidoglycan/LPS O-acetylase OafA/YrhL
MPAAEGSEQTPFLPALEGLRGVAATIVVVYHCWVRTEQPPLRGGAVRDFISSGFLSVDIFFVLSGFVLFLPVVTRGELGRTTAFWARRAARLLPAYWLVLALVVAGASLISADPHRIWHYVTTDSVAAHLVMMPGAARLIPGYDGALGFGADPVVWTMTVEALFALVLPLVATVCVRRPWLLLAAAVAGVALRAVIVAHGIGLSATRQDQLLSLVPPLLTNFALGMGAAVVWARTRGSAVGGRLASLAVPAALVLVVAAVLTGGANAGVVRRGAERSLLVGAVVPLAAAVLCAALAAGAGTVTARALSARPIRAAGRWSYGMYLVHFAIIGLCVTTFGLSTNGSTRAFVVMVAAVVPLALAYGAASSRFLEAPVRAWVRRYVSSSSAPRSTSATPATVSSTSRTRPPWS